MNKLKSVLYFVVAAIGIGMTGCAMQKINTTPQSLMSITDAKLSFKKFGYEDWALNPYVRKEAVCSAEKVYFPFNQFNGAIYSIRKATLTFLVPRIGICSGTFQMQIKEVDDANQLVRAINSLGSKIEYLMVVD